MSFQPATIRYGSERLDQLPLSPEPLQAMDYARIAPLLEEGYKLSRPLQHYVIAMVLFVVFSQSFIDGLITGYAPSLGQVRIALVCVKALIFGALLYMIDYFQARGKN